MGGQLITARLEKLGIPANDLGSWFDSQGKRALQVPVVCSPTQALWRQ